MTDLHTSGALSGLTISSNVPQSQAHHAHPNVQQRLSSGPGKIINNEEALNVSEDEPGGGRQIEGGDIGKGEPDSADPRTEKQTSGGEVEDDAMDVG